MHLNKRVFLLVLVIAIFQWAILFFVIPWFTHAFTNNYQVNVMTDGYDLIAMNLVEGRGYRVYAETSETLLRVPVYVYFLAGLFVLFGKSLAAVKVTNVIFAFVTAYLLYLVGGRVLRNNSWAIVPSTLYLVHPATLMAESRGGIESIFTFMILLFVFMLYRALENDRLKDYILLGIALGVTVLTRSTLIIFPPVLFIYLLVRSGWNFKLAFSRVAVMSTVMLVVVSPWLVRNYQVAGVLSPKETVAGFSAYNGYYINDRWLSGKSGGELLIESVEEQHRLAEDLGLSHKAGFFQYFYDVRDEVSFDNYLLTSVFHEYMRSPLKLARNMTLNFVRLWIHAGSWKGTMLNIILVLPLLIPAGLGIYLGSRRGVDIWPMLLVMGTIILAHLPILGVARHHVPFIPLLLILAIIPFARRYLWAGPPA